MKIFLLTDISVSVNVNQTEHVYINCSFVLLFLQFYYSLDDNSPKPVITVVLTDIDFLQMDENFGDLTTFQIIFTHIFTAHEQK